MQTFSDLLQSSAIVQGLIALVVIGALAYQVVIGQSPNETLIAMATLILGFYFGTKSQQAIARSHEEMGRALASVVKPREDS